MSQERIRTVPVVSVPPDLRAIVRTAGKSQAFQEMLQALSSVGAVAPRLRALTSVPVERIVSCPDVPIAARAVANATALGIELVQATKLAAAELTAPLPSSPRVEAALRAVARASTVTEVHTATASLVAAATRANSEALHSSLIAASTAAMLDLGLSVETLRQSAGSTEILASDAAGRHVLCELKTADGPSLRLEALNAGTTCHELLDQVEDALVARGIDLGTGKMRRLSEPTPAGVEALRRPRRRPVSANLGRAQL